MAQAISAAMPARLRERPAVLVRRAMGPPWRLPAKLWGLAVALLGYGSRRRTLPRLERLVRLGLIDAIPTRIQRMVGAVDMLRFFIVPCAADYYAHKGINFRFHTFLRFLDDPASLIDPTGFNSARDAIIGHVMQVVHANPVYDYQLLESFEDGLPELEAQVAAVIAGTHPRASSILAVIEDETYHARLLEHVRAYRADRNVPPLLRENVRGHADFELAERTFGSLPAAMRYFTTLPTTLRGALRHLVRVRSLEHAILPTPSDGSSRRAA